MCPACNCEEATLLGVLGTVPKLRCRACGWIYDGESEDVPEAAPHCESCGIAMPGDKEEGDICDGCADEMDDSDDEFPTQHFTGDPDSERFGCQ